MVGRIGSDVYPKAPSTSGDQGGGYVACVAGIEEDIGGLEGV